MKKTSFISVIIGIFILGISLYLAFNNSIFSQLKKTNLSMTQKLGIYLASKRKPKHFWRGDTMSIEEVCRRWGTTPLDLKKFKASEDNELVRAKMTCSLLKNQTEYYGIDQYKIREVFGPQTGYYFRDSIPAYIIETAQTEDEDTWQIVFLSDKDYRIGKIIVHKNCCD